MQIPCRTSLSPSDDDETFLVSQDCMASISCFNFNYKITTLFSSLFLLLECNEKNSEKRIMKTRN